MKTTIKFFAAVAISGIVACNSTKTENSASDSMGMMSNSDNSEAAVVPGEYTNLSTGERVYIIADPNTGYAIDSISRVPIEFYIDTQGDTLSQSGIVVNNALINADGKWSVDETKIKIRDNGDIKMKGPDGKLKITDDKIKLKDDEGKVKIEDDTVKIKN